VLAYYGFISTQMICQNGIDATFIHIIHTYIKERHIHTDCITNISYNIGSHVRCLTQDFVTAIKLKKKQKTITCVSVISNTLFTIIIN
jgi:hypothetical protein